ncbi:TlpA family protein disulfide reductase [Algoriphagus resistens]|uniref:TlpA family protein disulfide reductase n=1 Tax=Algoriphagus resistens TaxID=1750590 RepID=UPI000716A8BE|nr:TlpA disulfide reductase family protein [Algoriphagus resistens]
MRNLKFIIISLLIAYACKGKDNESERLANQPYSEGTPTQVIQHDGMEVGIYDFENFKPFLQRDNDSIYVVNFWATWCKPCIKELPEIEQIGQEYKDRKLKVVLASLDFPDKISPQLIPFAKKMNLQSRILVLDEADPNAWIPQVDSTWSGAVPATLVYSGSKRVFHNGPVTYEELQKSIDQLLTSN